MRMALTLTGIALLSLAAAGLLTVVAVCVAEIFRGNDRSIPGAAELQRAEAAQTNTP